MTQRLQIGFSNLYFNRNKRRDYPQVKSDVLEHSRSYIYLSRKTRCTKSAIKTARLLCPEGKLYASGPTSPLVNPSVGRSLLNQFFNRPVIIISSSSPYSRLNPISKIGEVFGVFFFKVFKSFNFLK